MPSLFGKLFFPQCIFFPPQNLDIGAKNIRIFFGGELLFSGDINKGCGNQVFDYSNSITLSPAPAKSNFKSKNEQQSRASKHGLVLNLSKPQASDHEGISSPSQKNIGNSNSPAGGMKHSIAASPSTSSSPVRSAAHHSHHQLPPSPSRGDVSPALTPSGSHHTFRSISRSSQSSASSSGSARLSRGRSQEGRLSGSSKVRGHSRDASRERQEGGAGRSETRTLSHPTVLLGRRGSTGSGGSGLSSPEGGDGPGSSGEFHVMKFIIIFFSFSNSSLLYFAITQNSFIHNSRSSYSTDFQMQFVSNFFEKSQIL